MEETRRARASGRSVQAAVVAPRGLAEIACLQRQLLPRRLEQGLLHLQVRHQGRLVQAVHRRQIHAPPIVDRRAGHRGVAGEERLRRPYLLRSGVDEHDVLVAPLRRRRAAGPPGTPVTDTAVGIDEERGLVAQARAGEVGGEGGRGERAGDRDAVDPRRRRHGVPGGLARLEPPSDRVTWRGGVGPVSVDVVVKVGGGQRGSPERPVAYHRVEAAGVGAGGLSHVPVALVDRARADREDVGPEDAVEVEARAAAVEAVESHGDLRAVAAGVGRRGCHVHGAGRVPQAEHGGVGSAADLDGVEHRGVQRHAAAGLEVGEGDVRGADAPHPVGAVRVEGVVGRASVAVDRELRVGPDPLGAGLVKEDVVDIEQREIRHLLLGYDGDRRGEVLDPRIEPRARHGVRRVIAPARTGDLERREYDGIPGARGGRRPRGRRYGRGGRAAGLSSCGGRGILRRGLGVKERGEQGQEQRVRGKAATRRQGAFGGHGGVGWGAGAGPVGRRSAVRQIGGSAQPRQEPSGSIHEGSACYMLAGCPSLALVCANM